MVKGSNLQVLCLCCELYWNPRVVDLKYLGSIPRKKCKVMLIQCEGNRWAVFAGESSVGEDMIQFAHRNWDSRSIGPLLSPHCQSWNSPFRDTCCLHFVQWMIKSVVVQGTIQWDPFWGNQTMRTYGNFDRSHRKKNEVWDDVIEWPLVLCCSWNNLVQFCWAWSADILGGFKWHLPMWVTAFNDLELGWLGRTSCCVFFSTSKWIKVMRIKGRDSFPFKRRSWKKWVFP